MIDIITIRDQWVGLHDSLTGLPNAALFYDRMQQALHLGRREDLRVVLMLVGLDLADPTAAQLDVEHRKLLLVEISDRLVANLRTSDSAGRLDLDHFAVMLPHTKEHGAEIVAGRILDALLAPILVGDGRVEVRASVGLAVAGESIMGKIEPSTLFDHARDALRDARLAGGGYAAHASPDARDLIEALG